MIHFAFFATIWIEAERKGPQVLSMRSLSRRQEGPIPKASIHKAPFGKIKPGNLKSCTEKDRNREKQWTLPRFGLLRACLMPPAKGGFFLP